MKIRTLKSARLTAGVLAFHLAVVSLEAATMTWNGAGADDNWQTVANWVGGNAPSAFDSLVFSGMARPNPINDFPFGTVFNNLAFDAGAQLPFMLSGNGISLLYASDAGLGTTSDGSITNASFEDQTVSLPIRLLTGKHNIAATLGGALLLNGEIFRDTGAMVFFDRSGGLIYLTGSGLTNRNGILGGWAIIGNDWASVDDVFIVVACDAYTPVSAGAISSDPASNVKYSNDTGDISADNVTINSLLTQQGISRALTVSGTLKLGSNGGIYRNSAALGVMTVTGGTLTAAGGGEITLADGPFTATANNLSVESAISNDGANTVAVNVAGYVNLGGANSYSGGTIVCQGRAQIGAATRFGTGPVWVYPGAQAYMSLSGTVANNFFVSGVGSTEADGGVPGMGAIRLQNSGCILGGTVNLFGNTRIGSSSSGPRITGRITGPGRAEFISATGDNNLTLANTTGSSNDWSGGTLISAEGYNSFTLKLGADDQIPDGAGCGDLTLNGVGVVTTWPGDTVKFDLNGFSETINGLISARNTISSYGVVTNNLVANFGTGTPTLTLGNNNASGTFGGVIGGGGDSLNITKIGSGTQTLSGSNTYSGTTLINAGRLVTTTASTGGGDYAVADGATLGVRLHECQGVLTMSNLTLGAVGPCTLEVDTPYLLSCEPPIVRVTGGGLTINGQVSVDLRGTYYAGGPFTILEYGSRNGAGNFVLGTFPPRVNAALNDDLQNHRVTITVFGAEHHISWNGLGGIWDVNDGWNLVWKTDPGNNNTFYQENPTGNDAVQFDDQGGVVGTAIITIPGDVSPASITVANSTNFISNYTFAGAGRIRGNAGLTVWGDGTLTIAGTGAHDFTGPIVLESFYYPGELVFDRDDDLTVGNTISGWGRLTKRGSGVLTLSGINVDYFGPVRVAAGTLRVANQWALGVMKGATVESGATLDIGGHVTANANYYESPFRIAGTGVGGQGAIINSSDLSQLNAFQRIVLTGDATIGGRGRWDIRHWMTLNASLSTEGHAYDLDKTGPNSIWLVNVAVDTNLADVTIRSGLLGYEASTSGLGNPTNRLSVWPGGTLGFFNSTVPLDKVMDLSGSGTNNTVEVSSGTANSIVGRVTLNWQCFVKVTGANALTLGGVVRGNGSLTKLGSGTLTLATNNTYSGFTMVEAGSFALSGSGSISNSPLITVASGATLNVSGRVDNTLTLVSGQALQGAGTVNGNLTINPGATLSPGASPGSLTVNGNVILAGTNVMEIDKAAGTNDLLTGATSIVYGGTLKVLTGTLTAGDNFKLFDAGSYSGAFDKVIPAIPGPGMVWNTNSLTADGTLKVVAGEMPGLTRLAVSGSSVVLDGTNGPANSTFSVLASTNLALPASNWTIIATSTFDGSGNIVSYTLTNAVNGPHRFFRLSVP